MKRVFFIIPVLMFGYLSLQAQEKQQNSLKIRKLH
jgi:hypothetical protein